MSLFKLKTHRTFKGRGYILSLVSHGAFLSLFFGILWNSKGRVEPSLSSVHIVFEATPSASLSSGKELPQKEIEKSLVSISSKVQDSEEGIQKLERKRAVSEEKLPFLEGEVQEKQGSSNSGDNSQERSQEIASQMLSSSPKAFMEKPEVRKKGILFYPLEALHQGQEGDVVLLLLIDQRGKVQDVSFRKRSGWELLDASAVENAKTLVFKPALKDGKPIIARLERRVSFRLEKEKNLSPLDREPLSRLDYDDDDLF